MQEKDFYTALKDDIRNAEKPVTIVHTQLSLTKNSGGQLNVLENQLPGAIKKNMNSEYMIGLKDADSGKERHIYIHTILEVITYDGKHYKLILN